MNRTDICSADSSLRPFRRARLPSLTTLARTWPAHARPLGRVGREVPYAAASSGYQFIKNIPHECRGIPFTTPTWGCGRRRRCSPNNEYQMTIKIDDVKVLFEQSEDCNAELRRNPVTGGTWMPKYNSTTEQLEKAHRALLARHAFATEGPADCQPLPTNYGEREDLKVGFGLGYVVALFARSLAAGDYRVTEHPPFAAYAAGILALTGVGPKFLSCQPSLAQRYPPRQLPGLCESGYWTNPS